MATLEVDTSIRSPLRLFTAADLAKFPTSLPSGEVEYELDQGRLVVMVPAGHVHSTVQVLIGAQFVNQGMVPGHGRAFTEATIVLARNPDTVLCADAAFVAASKLPVRGSPEGYLETIPDLVVEVRSKNDTQPEIDAKVATYLSAGVRIVWVADPKARTIVVHQPGFQPRVFHETDTLASDDPIPGLRVKVADIFL